MYFQGQQQWREPSPVSSPASTASTSMNSATTQTDASLPVRALLCRSSFNSLRWISCHGHHLSLSRAALQSHRRRTRWPWRPHPPQRRPRKCRHRRRWCIYISFLLVFAGFASYTEKFVFLDQELLRLPWQTVGWNSWGQILWWADPWWCMQILMILEEVRVSPLVSMLSNHVVYVGMHMFRRAWAEQDHWKLWWKSRLWWVVCAHHLLVVVIWCCLILDLCLAGVIGLQAWRLSICK